MEMKNQKLLALRTFCKLYILVIRAHPTASQEFLEIDTKKIQINIPHKLNKATERFYFISIST